MTATKTKVAETKPAETEVEPGFKMTELGPLPEEWEISTIGELFNLQQGKALHNRYRRGKCSYPFLRTANVYWGQIDLTTLDEMDFTEEERTRYSLLPGDLLVCEGGDIGRTGLWRGGPACAFQNHLHRLRGRDKKSHPDFFQYWMWAALRILGQYRGAGNKTTIPNLSGRRLKAFVVPLPPLPEQRAIAAVLNRVRNAIEVTDKVILAAKELKKSLMRHLFTYGPVPFDQADKVKLKETEIGEVPEEWVISSLSEHASRITKGSSPKWQGFDYCAKGVRFIRSQNIAWGYLDLRDVVRLPDAFNAKHETSIIQSGDVLLNLVGASIGRAAVATGEIDGANLNQAVCIVRMKDSIAPSFLMAFLLSKDGQRQMQQQKKEIARANISLQDVRKFSVPRPPLGEQRQISAVLEGVDSKRRAEEQRKSALDALFNTLLHLLMTGKVRVKDWDLDQGGEE